MKDKIDKFIEGKVTEGYEKPTILQKTIKLLKADEQLSGAFCFNLFTQDVEHAQDNIILSPRAKMGSAVNDSDMSCLRSYFTTKYNFSPPRQDLDDALIHSSMGKKYHPIKNYLEGLIWDGVCRLNKWLVEICGAEDNEYTQAVGRKMFVAMINRIYDPGCWWAQLVILEGKQRLYKSRLVKEIGQEWYASIHLKTQDTKTIVEEMRGKWILEIEELAGFGRQETEYMKAFVSRQHDRVRLSYGHRAEDYPRQSVMIATMNPDQENKYLVDQTGNVRYWPVECSEEKIKIDMFKDVRDQLFAEAMVLHQKKESLWLDGQADILAEEEQEKRLQVDPWGAIIEHWLNDEWKNKFRTKVTSNEVAQECLRIPVDKINSGIWRRVGRAISNCGWIKHRESKNDVKGNRNWFYTPPGTEPVEQMSAEQIKALGKWNDE